MKCALFIIRDMNQNQRKRKEGFMLNREEELILLKSWLFGNHREDIDHFEPKIFTFRKLFEDIREGITKEQVSVNIKDGKYKNDTYTDITYTEILCAETTGFMYYGTLGIAHDEQRKWYIQKLESDKDNQQHWIEKITEITNIINSKDAVPRCANFADLFITELEERQNEQNPRYGIKSLDKDTEGLHRGQLVVLSARPGCGKSALALQITNHVIEAGYKVVYLPLEMTEYETFQRMIIQQQVVYDADEAKNPTPQQKEDIRSFLADLEQSGLFSMYQGLNHIADIEKKVKEEEPFLLVVDQLTQVEPVGKAKDVREKYILMTNALKRIALQENICILALHQLNREGEGKKKPTLANLAESDSVGRDADVVLALNEHEETNDARLDALDLIIAKNRQGAVGAKIPLHFHGARYTFSESAPSFYDKYKQQHAL